MAWICGEIGERIIIFSPFLLVSAAFFLVHVGSPKRDAGGSNPLTATYSTFTRTSS